MTHEVNNSMQKAAEREGFYSRWSKRKAQQRSDQQDETQAELSTELSTELNSALETAADRQSISASHEEPVLLCDKDMPDLDSLDEDSDYSGFLSPGVSEELRKMALRKLFQGQGFNLCDGLDDYDEEFTSFEKLGDIVTADMRFQLQEEAKRKLQTAAENEAVSNENDVVTRLDEAYSDDEDNVNEALAASMPDEITAVDEESRESRNSMEQKTSSSSEKSNNEKLS